MTAIDWDEQACRTAWVAAYNMMRGPGVEGVRGEGSFPIGAVAKGEPRTGSGTTPTLIGDPKCGIVVVVDGHAPRNNLAAFWRGDIPDVWAPLPDPGTPRSSLDRRIAGILPPSHGTPEGDGYSCENSPAAPGHALLIAPRGGFAAGPQSPRDIQRVDWDPVQRRLKIVWINADVHINDVPTIGRGPASPCVFGMGREEDDAGTLETANGYAESIPAPPTTCRTTPPPCPRSGRFDHLRREEITGSPVSTAASGPSPDETS